MFTQLTVNYVTLRSWLNDLAIRCCRLRRQINRT